MSTLRLRGSELSISQVDSSRPQPTSIVAQARNFRKSANRQHVAATARPSPRRCEDHGPKEDCIQSSGAGYYVVPASLGLTHNSFSGAPNGFFAPGGTAVWQAEAAFEWLLATAFDP